MEILDSFCTRINSVGFIVLLFVTQVSHSRAHVGSSRAAAPAKYPPAPPIREGYSQ